MAAAQKEKYLVCCALPYANGPLHIGHLAGCYVPGDVYVRYRRLQGHDVHFVCGSDEHGAAITFKAIQEKTTAKEVVDKFHAMLKADLEAFDISVDIYSRTSLPLHIARSQDFFTRVNNAGFIEKRSEKRLYCDSCEQFLPERYVSGECPRCHKPGARGDQCEACGTWYEPEELIKPVCQLCRSTTATLRDTAHWYFSLDKAGERLTKWLESKKHWRKNVLGYAFQPIKVGLAARSITRDLDWGVPVPLNEAKGKVLYVWFDAPIGYISASEDWSIQRGEPERWRKYWEDKDTKLIHFIGKDNIVFHTVVWPALLMCDERYILPDLVAGNEFLNLEGDKISTSRNHAVWAGEVAKELPVDLMRYYLTRISPETSDSNFTWDEFQARVNSELADVIGNLANRVLTFLQKHYGGKIVAQGSLENTAIRERASAALAAYCSYLDQGLSKMALEEVVAFARYLNSFVQESAPWSLRKSDPEKAHAALHAACFGLKAVALLLYPVCPRIAGALWLQLGFNDDISSHRLQECLVDFSPAQTISQSIAPLVVKISDECIAALKAKLRN